MGFYVFHTCQYSRSNIGLGNRRTNGTEEHEDTFTAKVEKMSQGFLEVPYFFNATYLLMEIKGLVMYPKG